MRTSTPIRLISSFPQDQKSQQQLAREVARIHADVAVRYLRSLNCPAAQKLALLDGLIENIKKS